MTTENRQIDRTAVIYATQVAALAALDGKPGRFAYARDTKTAWLNDAGTMRIMGKDYEGLIAVVNANSDAIAALQEAGSPGAVNPLFGKTTLPNGTLPAYIENYAVRNPLIMNEYGTIQLDVLDTARVYLSTAKAIESVSPYWYRGFDDTTDYVRVYLNEEDAIADENHIAQGDVDAGTPGYYPLETVAVTDEVFAWFRVNDTFSWATYTEPFAPNIKNSNAYQFNKNTVAVGDSYELEVVLNLDTGAWGQEEDIRFFPFLTSGDGGLIPLASESGDVLGFFFPSAFIKGFVKANGWEGPFVLTVCVEITSVAEDSIGVRTWVKSPMPIEGALVQQETITMTATGFDGAAPTAAVRFTRIGDVVTVRLPTFNGTSNATTFTLTGSVPVWALPDGEVFIPVPLVRDSGANTDGIAYIDVSTGTISFGRSTGAGYDFGWTASGNKGIGSGSPQIAVYNAPARAPYYPLSHEGSFDPTTMDDITYFGMDFVASGSGLTAINPMSAKGLRYPALGST